MKELEPTLTRTVQLQLEEWGHAFMASNAEVMVRSPDVFNRFVQIGVRSLIPKQRIAEDSYTESYEVPSSVWQMWKERHAPLWLTNRWPVKYSKHDLTIRVERSLVYPEFKRLLPRSEVGRPVIYETVHRPSDGW